jgi:hypothetical protein
MSFLDWLGVVAILCFFGTIAFVVRIVVRGMLRAQMREEGLSDKEIEKTLDEAEIEMWSRQNLGGF